MSEQNEVGKIEGSAIEVAPKKKSLVQTVSDRYGIEAAKLLTTLKATVFKGCTDEQACMLLVVANEYKLNPFTRELFAFPKDGGIVPIVSIDGWIRIINEHPQFNGMIPRFSETTVTKNGKSIPEWCEVTIYRKDRQHPTVVSEYLEECYKESNSPWKSHPRRMLRHKAIIQAARVAFGFAGIYDEDEGRAILETNYEDVKPQGSATDRLALVIASQEEPLAADVQDEEPMQQAELPMEQS